MNDFSYLEALPEGCNLLVVLGPTACGKTRYAVALAEALSKKGMTAEIISADSRQVYREMDIGTGKDREEYHLSDGRPVACHLVDIREAGDKYNVYEYQRDFVRVFREIRQRGHFPILCGGTGLYIEAVLKGYPLVSVPENPVLRQKLQHRPLEELTALLAAYKQRHGDSLHNRTDTDTVKRAVRAIEIETYYEEHAGELSLAVKEYPVLLPYIVGMEVARELRRKRISQRLHTRLAQGMVAEVKNLLDKGVAPEDLTYYGLEYKYLTLFLTGQLPYDTMVRELETAIHQFAKRQMTWFRGMERRGTVIHWKTISC